MTESYNRKQAMQILEMQSTNAFLQLARKHPDVFIVVGETGNKPRQPLYDKASLDRFAELQADLKKTTAR